MDSQLSMAATFCKYVNLVSVCGRYGRLKQVALRSVAHSLAADSDALRGMREMFEQLDTDGNGLISHADMVKARALGLPRSSPPDECHAKGSTS